MSNSSKPQLVQFNCSGKAVGKMRCDLDVEMVSPWMESFELATDEGSFHGGDASAPPPLALFVGGLTGCIMTQLRAFAKRMKVQIDDLNVECRVAWQWTPIDHVYETAPKSFEIDISLESPNSLDEQLALVEAAKKGCFIEQTLGRTNSIRHRLKTAEGYLDVEV